MAFITDKEELAPGLIIFRRTDVDHRNWYCRIKVPKADRYKTISLKTSNINDARTGAFRAEMRLHLRVEDDMPIFNKPFSGVAEEYVAFQKRRAASGEITRLRVKKIESIIKAQLNPYVGTTQIHLIGHERWENYPTWRRETAEGRVARTGQTRPLTEEEKKAAKAKADATAKAAAIKVTGKHEPKTDQNLQKKEKTEWVFASDATIATEMSVFSGIMNFAASKRYIPVANKFGGRPKLKTERRDEFSLEEYRKLHTVGRQWMKAPDREASRWSREVTYNFMLIMCNTGMRPPEATNLRWRDITRAEDKDKRQLVVIYVRGKGKERKLVAPASVGE
jgi:integrase